MLTSFFYQPYSFMVTVIYTHASNFIFFYRHSQFYTYSRLHSCKGRLQSYTCYPPAIFSCTVPIHYIYHLQTFTSLYMIPKNFQLCCPLLKLSMDQLSALSGSFQNWLLVWTVLLEKRKKCHQSKHLFWADQLLW